MHIRYYIDPETELPHIYNHYIDERGIEDIGVLVKIVQAVKVLGWLSDKPRGDDTSV